MTEIQCTRISFLDLVIFSFYASGEKVRRIDIWDHRIPWEETPLNKHLKENDIPEFFAPPILSANTWHSIYLRYKECGLLGKNGAYYELTEKARDVYDKFCKGRPWWEWPLEVKLNDNSNTKWPPRWVRASIKEAAS